jgi:hypothetical protein
MIFGRKKDERTVANQDGSAILNELVKVLQKDAEFPDDEWVSFALIGWFGGDPARVVVYSYDRRGEPFFVDITERKYVPLLERLRAATEGERGELWRAAVMGFVRRDGKLSGEFFYGDDANVWEPSETNGEKTYGQALLARPEDPAN